MPRRRKNTTVLKGKGMGKTLKFQAETILNLLLLIIGIVVMIESLNIGFGTLRAPGSGLFTFLSGLLMILTNFVMILKPKAKKSDIVLDRYGTKKFVYMGITMVLWIILMPLLGYLVVTFIATFVLAKIMKLEGWVKPFFLSIGTAALCYVLFDYVLYLDLPRGFLG